MKFLAHIVNNKLNYILERLHFIIITYITSYSIYFDELYILDANSARARALLLYNRYNRI